MVKSAVNPALKEIETLVGEWTMELSNASFLPDPSTTVKGKVTFEWLEEGDFLVMRHGKKGKDMWASWIIGRDEDSQKYTVLYIDNRRVSRVYEMSFKKNEWKIWRNSPGFSQRFLGILSKGKKTIKAYWEKSSNGKKWERDFDVLYKLIE